MDFTNIISTEFDEEIKQLALSNDTLSNDKIDYFEVSKGLFSLVGKGFTNKHYFTIKCDKKVSKVKKFLIEPYSSLYDISYHSISLGNAHPYSVSTLEYLFFIKGHPIAAQLKYSFDNLYEEFNFDEEKTKQSSKPFFNLLSTILNESKLPESFLEQLNNDYLKVSEIKAPVEDEFPDDKTIIKPFVTSIHKFIIYSLIKKDSSEVIEYFRLLDILYRDKLVQLRDTLALSRKKMDEWFSSADIGLLNNIVVTLSLIWGYKKLLLLNFDEELAPTDNISNWNSDIIKCRAKTEGDYHRFEFTADDLLEKEIEYLSKT